MIGKITHGSDFRVIAKPLYAFEPGPGRLSARSVAEGMTLVIDTARFDDWVRDMQFFAGYNRQVSKPVWHCAVHAAPQDPILDDEEWGQIGREHVAEMGLGDYPWVAVRNRETTLHIVACRVNIDGSCWSDSQDYRRSRASLRRIERRHRLTVVDEDYQAETADIIDIADRPRRAHKPLRDLLEEHVLDAVYAARQQGIDALEAELTDRGVGFRHQPNKTFEVTLPGWTVGINDQIWMNIADVNPTITHHIYAA